MPLNANLLVKRIAEPAGLIESVAREVRLHDLQPTLEFINPRCPAALARRPAREMDRALRAKGVRVSSGMTGPYGRLNHFVHPDRELSRYYVDWFKAFADINADLGGHSVGTQFATSITCAARGTDPYHH